MSHIDLFLAQYGYFALFGLLMLGIVGPLIPDETILVLTGIAIHRGQMNFGWSVLIGFAGSLCGITLSYFLGRTGAVYVLRRWLNEAHLAKAHAWFEKYGKWTLFFGYFVAGIRHFTALTAGISRLEYRPFAIYAYPGALVWVTCFLSIGYFLGEKWEQIHPYLSRGAVIGALVLCVAAYLVYRLKRKP